MNQSTFKTPIFKASIDSNGESGVVSNTDNVSVRATTIESNIATAPDGALLSNDQATTTAQLTNPFATTSGGGGSVGIWFLLLLAGFNLKTKTRNLR